jgi:hypothetical protein
MNYRKKTCLNYRKNGHGFRRPVDAHSPLLPEKQKYRRDQGARMPNTYPPHKVRNVPRPAYRFVESPGTEPCGNGIYDTTNSPEKCHEGNGKNDPPLPVGPPFYGSSNIYGNIVVTFISND